MNTALLEHNDASGLTHEIKSLIQTGFKWEAADEATTLIDRLADALAHLPAIYKSVSQQIEDFATQTSSAMVTMTLEVSDNRPEDMPHDPNRLILFEDDGQIIDNALMSTMRLTIGGTKSSMANMSDLDAYMESFKKRRLVMYLGACTLDDLIAQAMSMDLDLGGLSDVLLAMGMDADAIQEMIALLGSGDAPPALREAALAIMALTKVNAPQAIEALLLKLEKSLGEATPQAKSEKMAATLAKITPALQAIVKTPPATLVQTMAARAIKTVWARPASAPQSHESKMAMALAAMGGMGSSGFAPRARNDNAAMRGLATARTDNSSRPQSSASQTVESVGGVAAKSASEPPSIITERAAIIKKTQTPQEQTIAAPSTPAPAQDPTPKDAIAPIVALKGIVAEPAQVQPATPIVTNIVTASPAGETNTLAARPEPINAPEPSISPEAIKTNESGQGGVTNITLEGIRNLSPTSDPIGIKINEAPQNFESLITKIKKIINQGPKGPCGDFCQCAQKTSGKTHNNESKYADLIINNSDGTKITISAEQIRAADIKTASILERHDNKIKPATQADYKEMFKNINLDTAASYGANTWSQDQIRNLVNGAQDTRGNSKTHGAFCACCKPPTDAQSSENAATARTSNSKLAGMAMPFP